MRSDDLSPTPTTTGTAAQPEVGEGVTVTGQDWADDDEGDSDYEPAADDDSRDEVTADANELLAMGTVRVDEIKRLKRAASRTLKPRSSHYDTETERGCNSEASYSLYLEKAYVGGLHHFVIVPTYVLTLPRHHVNHDTAEVSDWMHAPGIPRIAANAYVNQVRCQPGVLVWRSYVSTLRVVSVTVLAPVENRSEFGRSPASDQQ